MKPPAIIFVIGFHRSGTSATTGVLKRLGYNVGPTEDNLPINGWNEKGYFEQIKTMELNDDILGINGGSWFDPPKTISEINGNFDPMYHPVFNRLHSLGTSGFPLVIKDPRLCLTWPWWRDITPGFLAELHNDLCDEFEVDYRIVFVKRNPIASIKSFHKSQLKHRSIEDCVELYSEYQKRIWKIREKEIYRRVSIVEIDYENLLTEPDNFMFELNKWYGIKLTHPLRDSVKRFVDPLLNHHGDNK